MMEVIKKLFFPLEQIKKLCEKLKFIIALLFIFPIMILLYCIFFGKTEVIVAIIISAIFAIAYFILHLYNKVAFCSPIGFIMSAIISLFMTDKTSQFLNKFTYYNVELPILFQSICFFIIYFFIIALIFGLILKYCSNSELNFKSMLKLLICFAVLFFTIFIYLPFDTYINNFLDFNFPLKVFIFHFIVKTILYLIPIAYIGSIIKEKYLNFLISLLLGLNIAVYLQYMFMNKNLGLIIGESVEWEEYNYYGAMNLFIWIALIIASFAFLFIFKKIWYKISILIPIIIGAIQLISIIIMILFTGNDIYNYSNTLPIGDEQYTISANKNIITFIFDATDNLYFEKILKDSPESFDGLEDFTLYTNTCSVHDYTMASITQMLSGIDTCPIKNWDDWNKDAWNSDKANDFYNRFHNANYTMNTYMKADVDWELTADKYDNVQRGLEPDYIDIDGITKNLQTLTRYRYMPFVFKQYFEISNIDFKNFVKYPSEFYYQNDDYIKNLKLKKSDNDNNYFIIEHLNGTHPPCSDMIEETKKCLNIVKEYISQMKELGVYDAATIIITSDHGRHTSDFTEAAATPIFMIKEANNSFENMKISNAPVYHADFLSTYLINAGLFTDNDREIFGKSIYDFDDNSQRERIWYDHRSDENYPNPLGKACNVYYAYKYNGNAKTLQDMILNNKPDEVIVDQ